MIEFDEKLDYGTRIKVIGVGGAGNTVVDKMADWSGDIDVIAINTDVRALKQIRLRRKIRIGARLTNGLGAGGNPEIGRKAVEQEKERVLGMLSGADLVFIVAGLGGGAGTGAGPVIGGLVSEVGAISVGVVTRPFVFEGIRKTEAADAGIKELRKTCDTLITIPNEKLFARAETNSFLLDAFDVANSIILEAVKAICSLVKFPGLINIDFANVREVLRKSGDACFGVGAADGKERARKAAGLALNSPLLQNADISSGKNILVSVAGGENIRREELDDISETLSAKLGKNPNVVMGAAIDKKLGGKVRVTVIVTGLTIITEKKTPEVSEEPLSHFISGRAVYPGQAEDELDIPTFMRKKRSSQQED